MPRKKTVTSAPSTKTSRTSQKPTVLEQKIIENLVELQKVHADLAEKFDTLAREISSLLAIFEVTAKSFAKNAPLGEYEKDKEFLEKIDKLLDQNKVLAKGLTLMEERLRERVYGPQPAQQYKPGENNDEQMQQSIGSRQTQNRPLPRF